MSSFNPIKAVTALFACVSLFFGAISSFDRTVDENIARQNDNMSYLENEFYESYTPTDESKIADFDINEAVANDIKFNEVAFLGTHNSYKAESPDEYKQLYESLNTATFGIFDMSKPLFKMDTITNQLELGIRSIEIDIETTVTNGETKFIVCHSPLTDAASMCYDFETMLNEIKMWSDNNPGHLPVSVIIEPKKSLPPIRGLKNFSLKYANALDGIITDILGETLLTPAEMMGSYDSFKDMREDDGWLSLGDTLSKVLVLLHDTTVTADYINQDTSVKSQAMFPMLRYNDRNKSYASFIIDNTPSDALKHKSESIDKCRLIVRTRADNYPSYDNIKYRDAQICGSQIISTDYPPTTFEKEHTFTFDNGFTVKLNK